MMNNRQIPFAEKKRFSYICNHTPTNNLNNILDMKRLLSVLVTLTALALQSSRAQERFQGFPITEEGAWCWFADPRAIHYTSDDGSINASYIGYIDVHGNVKAMQMDYNTGRRTEVLVRSYFQPDDHNNPTFLVLPDERVLIIYSRHTDEAAFYYRVSKHPGDISMLGEEKRIATNHNTTYPSPFLMSDDPEHFYLCWRGLGWHPTIARLTLPDENDNVEIAWGPYQMVQSTGARPYAKYYSNGKDKLYMTYTTGHPDNEWPNWVYFNVINLNATTTEGKVNIDPKLEDIMGNPLSTIAEGKFGVNKSDAYRNSYPYTLVDAPSNYRDWVWQITCDKEGRPCIAMVRINNDKSQHQYYYARWTGTQWQLTDLADGGGRFHPSNTEHCYSGGLAIDPEDAHTVYLSAPTSNDAGKKVYELWRYTLDDQGGIAAKEQITRNSTKNNVRPYVLPGSSASPMRLLWMHGDYYYWLVRQGYPQGFPTAIHADYDFATAPIDLERGLLAQADYHAQAMTADMRERLPITATDSLTIHLSLKMDANHYSGTLLTMGDITYGLEQTTAKPYVKVGDTYHYSSNRLYTSDNWATQSNGTSGDNWPTPLQEFSISITLDGTHLTTYRNGLIDQVIPVQQQAASEAVIGGYSGVLYGATLYGRVLAQEELKQLIRVKALEQLSLPTATTTDLVLPTQVGGKSLAWSSDHAEILAPDGTFKAPAEATTVNLTASADGMSRTFNIEALPRDIEANLLAEYTFDPTDMYEEGAARYLRDKGAKGLDLQIMGNATVDGTLNLSANRTGATATNGYAIAPAKLMDSLRSYTVLLTATPESLDKAPRFYDFGYSSGNSLFLRAQPLSAGIKYNGGTTTMVNSSSSLAANTTYKVAVTYDARSGITQLFINGELAASGTANINEPYMIAANGTCTRNYIGRTQWWDTDYAADNADYTGTIDNFMVYNTALTPQEIATLQGIRQEDEALNISYNSVLSNPDFEDSYSTLSGSGVASDRAIYVPDGWKADYTNRNENDMSILNSSCLYSSLFTSVLTTQGGGRNAYLVRQKWGTSSIGMHQQCDTLPAGYYTLMADLWQSGSGGQAILWAQAGNDAKNSGTAASGTGTWERGKVTFLCNGIEQVALGFTATHTTNGSEMISGFDNFTLFNTTANRNEEELLALLAEMQVAAKEVLKGELNSDIRTLLSESCDAAAACSESTPHAELLEAYYPLRDALALRHTPTNPSGIASLPSTIHTATYDLNGYKSNALLPGIYIENSRKVIKRH